MKEYKIAIKFHEHVKGSLKTITLAEFDQQKECVRESTTEGYRRLTVYYYEVWIICNKVSVWKFEAMKNTESYCRIQNILFYCNKCLFALHSIL